ncbi:GIP, partial [Symbiodinium microadriaticum]
LSASASAPDLRRPGSGGSDSLRKAGAAALAGSPSTQNLTTTLYEQMKSKGLFKNHFPNIPPAGKSINVPLADSSERDLQPEVYFPLPQTPVNERKYRRISHQPGEIYVHHGLKDQKLPAEEFRYGIRGQKGASTEDTMKAGLLMGVAAYQNEVAESIYESRKKEPLGKPFHRGHSLKMLPEGYGNPSGSGAPGRLQDFLEAELMLLALPTTYTKDRWGAKLLEYVSGEAEEVCEGLALEKITKEDGHKLIFDALDGRYRELEKEALHNHLHEYFYELKIRPGESYRNMTVRLDTSYRRLQEHSVELPEEVRGWFLLQKLKLDQAAQALLLTSTKGSLKYSEINKAVQAIFPQGVAASTTGRTREVFSAEGDETMDIESENAEDVYEAIAEQFQLADEYEEEDALDVFETYKDIRRRVQEKKLGRGYKGHQDGDWKLSGTLKGKLELMKSKTRCHVCKELGHWKRECPKRTQQSGGRQTRAGGSNDAMVADDSGEGYKNLAEEHFLDIDEIEKYEIFLAERGGEIDVVVASKDEAIDQNDEVKGDFEHSLQQFFTSSAGSNRTLELLVGSPRAKAMSYAGQMEQDVPMEWFMRTQLITELLSEVSAVGSPEELSDLSAKILDEAPDLSDDEPVGDVPGIAGSLGNIIFNVGKFQKAGQLVNFKTAYLTDKRYTAWVRKFIKGKSDPATGKTNHPTMTQYRLYVALRDQRKSMRLKGMNEQGQVEQHSQVPLLTSRPKARATPPTGSRASSSNQSAVVTTSGAVQQRVRNPPVQEPENDDQWLLMPATGQYRQENQAERRRRLIHEQIENLTHQLELLEESEATGYGVDVMLLQVGSGEEVSRPKSHHVTKLRRATEFNQQLCVDTFEQEVRDQRVHFLNICDEATGYQMCVPLWKGMQAKVVRNAYRKNWRRWAGAPVRLFSDGGKEFEGEFEHGLSLDGTYGDTSAAYSPWQNGLVEKRGDVWKTAYAKAQLEAFLEADGAARVRKAMEHRNRFENRHHWHGPAVVIGKSGGSKVWVAKGTKVYRCCPEQLRALSPDQEAAVRLLPADMVCIRDNVSARGAGNYHDLSALERPPDVEEGEQSEPPLEHGEEDWRQAAGVGPMEEVENEPVAPPDNRQGETRGPVASPGDESPSKRARVQGEPSALSQMMRANLELLDSGRPASSGAGMMIDASAVPVPEGEEPDDGLEVHITEGDHWIIDHGRRKLVRVHVVERDKLFVPELANLPVKSSDVEAQCVVIGFDRLGTKKAVSYAHQASGELSLFKRGVLWTGRTEFSLKDGWSVVEGTAHECHEVQMKKGRKEVNEREIAADRREGLDKAKLKEWKKLVDSGAILVHEGDKARHLRHGMDSKRILKSRFVVTEAEPQSSPQTCDLKARWCIRGYLDPDLLDLDTSAPTLTMEGFAVAMQLLASKKWKLNIADVEGAFLRGDALDPKRGRLFIELPPGGVPGIKPGSLVEAVKTVYGLADAPKAWWSCFKGKLESLGMKMSRFDSCLFYYYSRGEVAGTVALHVDDLCAGGNQEFEDNVLKPLREMYPFKHWKVGKGEFLGKMLEQQSDGSICIQQSEYAKQFKGLDLSRLRRREKSDKVTEEERTQMRGILGGVNWLVSGSRPDLAAWRSLLQQRVCDATVGDLVEVNKLVSQVHDNHGAHVWIRHIPCHEVQFAMLSDASWANAMGCCSQAGYMIAACDQKLPSGQWGVFSVLRWRSYKQSRQTHSTLGAELLALSRGLAEVRWVRSMWAEALQQQYELRNDEHWSCKIPITAVIDCKPVFDHVGGPLLAVKDKRVAIEMMLVKEDIARYNVSLRWMATKQMIVDVLTKRGAPLNLFKKVMKEGRFILVENEEVAAVTSKGGKSQHVQAC